MSEIPRTGAGAASRPRDEDLIANRDSITERFDPGDGLTESIFRKTAQPEDESPYLVNTISYPLWEWPEMTPTAQERPSTGISPILRPPETEGQTDPTFYSTWLRWPTSGVLNELLGMFIRSRPKGATLWRSSIDYRPFTAETEQYGPANQNIRDLYAEQLNPSAGDEYQVATRYVWTPDPYYEFLGEVLDGAEFPRVQPIMVAELVQNASVLIRPRNIVHPNLFVYGTFGETDLIEAEERQAIAFSNGAFIPHGIQQYVADFAETQNPDDLERTGSANASGILKVHGGSFFTYADDVEGIIIID